MSIVHNVEVKVIPFLFPEHCGPNRIELHARIKTARGEFVVKKFLVQEHFDTKGLFDIIWKDLGRELKAELDQQLESVPEVAEVSREGPV